MEPLANQITRLIDGIEPGIFDDNFRDGTFGEDYGVLNLPAFLVHGLMILCDETFTKARSYFGRREEFYNALRAFFWVFEFQTRVDFLLFVSAHARRLKVKPLIRQCGLLTFSFFYIIVYSSLVWAVHGRKRDHIRQRRARSALWKKA
ncbi:MAG: hypothetical protein LBQ88_17965 [Treponema sp.]|jgi:hypothetical protein|nr:hypothetical protein [Treponema sp.]